jgi:hypothetical protein
MAFVKSIFKKDIQTHTEKSALTHEVFSEKDIASLPEPVQKHFKMSGLIGKPKMAMVAAYMPAVPLKDTHTKPPMIINFDLRLFAYRPIRLAYIKTSVFGIPFEGYDCFQNGTGFMKGVIGKFIPLFNQKGIAMSKAQLITYLGEALLCPSIFISEYIKWEQIDDSHVKATITCDGISGSGIFAFSNDGFIHSFTTDERARISTNGETDYPKWSCVCENFEDIDGLHLPKTVKAIWHLTDGDLVYFESSNISFSFM